MIHSQALSLLRIVIALCALAVSSLNMFSPDASIITITFGVASIVLSIGLLVGLGSKFCALLLTLLYAAAMGADIIPASNTNLLIICAFLCVMILPIDRYWSFAAALRYDDLKTRQKTSWPPFLQKRRARLNKNQMYYDPDCGFCKATANIFREFCIGANGSVEPSTTNNSAHELLLKHDSWVLFADDGQTYLEWRAVAYMLQQSPVFWLFGVVTDLTFMRPIMARFYHLIGDNRQTLSRVLRPALTPRPEKPASVLRIVVCSVLILILVCMIVGFDIFSLL
jgi:predicted DCC family thiol-disulfide oxidoreductase YuxK